MQSAILTNSIWINAWKYLFYFTYLETCNEARELKSNGVEMVEGINDPFFLDIDGHIIKARCIFDEGKMILNVFLFIDLRKVIEWVFKCRFFETLYLNGEIPLKRTPLKMDTSIRLQCYLERMDLRLNSYRKISIKRTIITWTFTNDIFTINALYKPQKWNEHKECFSIILFEILVKFFIYVHKSFFKVLFGPLFFRHHLIPTICMLSRWCNLEACSHYYSIPCQRISMCPSTQS